MRFFDKIVTQRQKLLKILAWFIIAVGIGVRILVYLQNRNLMMDEANLARNIYERGFTELLMPLNYEQFAPPLFLWILKCSTLLFGYSEYAYRIYPMLAGMGALIMLMLVLKELTSFKSLWYPLFLIVAGHIFIRYSSELKQHGCDLFAVMSLILLALKIDIQTKRSFVFIIVWALMGTIAMWLSFPCIFVLAGVGAYYFYICISKKKYRKLIPLFITGLFWCAQFLLYYFIILKKEASSDYIQTWLAGTFLLFPKNKGDLMHNWYLVKRILEVLGGGRHIFWVTNLFLLLLGTGWLLIKHTPRVLLIIVPLTGVFFASLLQQYAIVDRYMIFVMGLFVLLIGCGFEIVMKIRPVYLRIVPVLFAVWCMYDRDELNMAYNKFRNEEMTEVMTYMRKNNIPGDKFYVHMTGRPAMIYYTTIHPQKEKWSDYKNSHLLWWDVDYDTLAQHITGKAGFVFESPGDDELNKCRASLDNYLVKIGEMFSDPAGRRYAYIYIKP